MRYFVGIDLGTTHCAVAVATQSDETDPDKIKVIVLPISQWVSAGNVQAQSLLPSFGYLPLPAEVGALNGKLPWSTAASADAKDQDTPVIVGEFARANASSAPNRVVSSAKSWLSYAGSDAEGTLLPVGRDADGPGISPVRASETYLSHMRAAFESAYPGVKLDEQHVVVTVPASFDPRARELTAVAMERAGLAHATLLEEPQAAVYAWIAQSEGPNDWRKNVKAGDTILVVDVGGGTTDFSLVAVRDASGALELERLAVGDHILLGGDNMDLAIAADVRDRLARAGKTLDAWQLSSLVHACRAAKEILLAGGDADRLPLTIQSRGSKLIGGTIRAELSREDVSRLIVDGFFPVVGSDAKPVSRPRSALMTVGLPYAQDAAVTRHLAAFIARQVGTKAAFPTHIMFNGGVFRSKILQEAILRSLVRIAEEKGAPAPRRIEAVDLDCAVAVGAAYFARAKTGVGIRIRGGSARTYYVGVEAAAPAVPGLPPPLRALCVVPFGLEEGERASNSGTRLGLVVGESVRFRFFGSTTRRKDAIGTHLDAWREDELVDLGEIEASLEAEGRVRGDVVPVYLEACVTETGTLLLEAIPVTPQFTAERWRVELAAPQ